MSRTVLDTIVFMTEVAHVKRKTNPVHAETILRELQDFVCSSSAGVGLCLQHAKGTSRYLKFVGWWKTHKYTVFCIPDFRSACVLHIKGKNFTSERYNLIHTQCYTWLTTRMDSVWLPMAYSGKYFDINTLTWRDSI